MRFEITHRTRYSYGREVTLEPHTLRFRPRSDGNQRLIDFRIAIEPAPAMISECLDAEGNTVTRAWFTEPADVLFIHSWSAVETTRSNPFDFLLTHQDATAIPLLYPEELRKPLAHYCEGAPIDWEVQALSDSVAAEVNWDTSHFLTELSNRIFKICIHEPRPEGDPQPPGITLKRKCGACRDLAVLFMDACRAQGLAARFVSGYQRGAEEWEKREMHAWAEVYLPGGGWRGYDPSHALAAADQLVAVAAAANPRDAAPVSGTYRGAGADPKLEFDLEIR
jgi:transglutaminase-like putative cysteine protease